jgi:hypothetical protein
MAAVEHELPVILDAAHETALALVASRVRYDGGAYDREQYQADAEAALAAYYIDEHEKLRNGFLQVALIELAAWAVRPSEQ